jgi:hypothetical protein
MNISACKWFDMVEMVVGMHYDGAERGLGAARSIRSVHKITIMGAYVCICGAHPTTEIKADIWSHDQPITPAPRQGLYPTN